MEDLLKERRLRRELSDLSERIMLYALSDFDRMNVSDMNNSYHRGELPLFYVVEQLRSLWRGIARSYPSNYNLNK